MADIGVTDENPEIDYVSQMRWPKFSLNLLMENDMNSVDAAWRAACLMGALILGAISAYGGFEFTKKLEGGISYIVIASPVVIAFAALIPPIGEWQWKRKQYVKSIVWWLVLLPAAYFVFCAATERYHAAQAGAQAERSAYSSQVVRAENSLETLKSEAKAAKEASDKTKAREKLGRKCNSECLSIREKSDRLAKEVSDAEKALLNAEKQKTVESGIWFPPWLLGLTMDLMVFVAVWTGLHGTFDVEETKKAKRRYRRRKPSTPKHNVTPLRVVK